MIPWLETPRLLLRRFTADDRVWLGGLYADPEVTRYLGGTQTPDAIDRMLRHRILDYYEEHPGLGIWMTIERDTGERAGFHLLNNIQGESIIQVGFALARWAWGRGYGTEMGSAVLRHGFVTLGIENIAGMASPATSHRSECSKKLGSSVVESGPSRIPHMRPRDRWPGSNAMPLTGWRTG